MNKEPIKAVYLDRHKTKGKITHYTLANIDEPLNQFTIPIEELKEKLKNGELIVESLYLTKDNRIVIKKSPTSRADSLTGTQTSEKDITDTVYYTKDHTNKIKAYMNKKGNKKVLLDKLEFICDEKRYKELLNTSSEYIELDKDFVYVVSKSGKFIIGTILTCREHITIKSFDSLFKDCQFFKSIDLSGILTTDTSMNGTFVYCYKLEKVIGIPNTIKTLDCTFYHCDGLRIAPDLPNSVKFMYETFCECINLVEIKKFPNKLEKLCNAFYNCESLLDVGELPDTLIDMAGAFYGCIRLIEIKRLPHKLEVLDNTFKKCESLIKSPVIPDSVKLMDGAFSDCTSLLEPPEIPDSVQSAYGAFYGCKRLLRKPV